MVWDRSRPADGVECLKIRWEIVPYTRGRVLDIGCGPNKAFPHFLGVDNGHHQQYGYTIKPDILSGADKLDLIASGSCDAVFSSHLLEHFPYEDVPRVLAEWFRVVKKGGHVILYVPAQGLYPDPGEEGANPDHKFAVTYENVVEAAGKVPCGWDLVDYQLRDQDDEYSHYFVFRRAEKAAAREYSWQQAKPEKRALVCRFGAYGDLLQASSVLAGLKEQGFHVSLLCSPPGVDVVKHDPNVDRFIITDKDQIPNHLLGEYWAYVSKRYDRFVNLSESVEGTLLALPTRINHSWPHALRHEMLNQNYLEFQHKLAGIPHKPQVRFYPTLEEKAWARKERERMGKRVVMWALAGSSVHKANPYMDPMVCRLMIADAYNTHPCVDQDTHVVLVGGPECAMLEAGFENEPRVHRTCGKWSIRQTLAFLDQCDLVIGGETGVLNAASGMDVQKVVFLSHSSRENLTRDWINTQAIDGKAPCWPCHRLHYNWDHCHEDKESGTALCQIQMDREEIWTAIVRALWKVAPAPLLRAA